MKKFLKYIDKKKSKLYSMFGLLILIFSFINFSSAGTLTKVYTGTFHSTIGTSNLGASYTNFLYTHDYGIVGYINSNALYDTNVSISYVCNLSNFSSSDYLDTLKSSSQKLKATVYRGYISTSSNSRYLNAGSYNQTSYGTWASFNSSSNSITFTGTLSNSFYYLGSLYFQYANSSVSSSCSYNSSPSLDKTCFFDFDYSCTITYSGDNISDNSGSSSSNCSSVESQLSTCQSDLATATGNVASLTSSLSSCQSDLATATGNISSLSGSLATCQSDLTTCQNSSSSSCDYSEYESTISSLSGSLASCTTNYNSCTSELNSCLSNSGSCSGTGVQWSSLWINNIQHLGASSIFITIPEEINWSYTNENDEFDLDVVGYNVDTEYIESIIDTQTNKPDKVDLNNIITGLIPLFVPGFVIILFIYFAFRLIKKIF